MNNFECLTPEVTWFARTIPPHVIKYRVKDDKLLSSLMKSVDDEGDKMGHSTNLMCDMTSYRSQTFSPHKSTYEKTIDLISDIFRVNDLELKVIDIWVGKYVSQDYARRHNHGDALWSFCIYLNEGKDFPPLQLENFGEVEPEKGLLIFFPSWVFHEVKSKKFEGARYVCAGNIKSI